MSRKKDPYTPRKTKPLIELVMRADTSKKVFGKSKAVRDWKFKHWTAKNVIMENKL